MRVCVPKRELGLLAALLLAAAPASAQVASIFNGSYLALSGGVVALDDAEIDYGGVQPGGNIQFDAGWAVSGAAGWRVLHNYRVEFEVSHRDNDLSDYACCFGPEGSVTTTTYMVNGYYDFPTYPYAGMVPYIGLGVGRAQFVHNIQVNGGTLSNSNSHAFAYQVIGGLEFPIIARRMSATFEFRYLGTNEPTFQDQGGFRYQSDYNSYTFFAGLRWGF
jgi:Outer membrane protein beta-barrel domain